ncbi:glycosyltransferase [Sphingobium cupriresistens]|jgi:glycosyltransferase involved in cell wall biosynthesis|nr:glycosyltransferase [Sphingobium cupriresistens]
MSYYSPLSLITGLPGTRRKVVLFAYMLSQGGTDRVTALLARGYADAGFDVELLVLCRGGTAQSLLSDMIGPLVSVRYISQRSTWRTIDLVRLFPALVRALRTAAPDVLISTANNTAWVCTYARKIAQVETAKLVLKTTNPVIGSRHRGPIRKLRRWGYGKAFSHASAIWTLSGAETRLLEVGYPQAARRIRTVINPYVTDAMLSPDADTSTTTSPLVLGIGRLTRQKRFDLLISAFALVRREDARLLIFGDGPDRKRLEQLVTALGLTDRVTLPGYVPDVAEWLKRADLFVLPSRYEGLPAVALEAMAANCPVLSTDCFAAARSLLGSATGCGIIDKADPAYLAQMIDNRLDSKKPTTLRAIAQGHSVAAGIADHVRALCELWDDGRTCRPDG